MANVNMGRVIRATTLACAVVFCAGNLCYGQAAPSDLSPDVQEVLRLSQQHMDDSFITNYIISSGKAYKLSADDIIYLNNQGVSQGVINTLLETTTMVHSQPVVAPAAPVVATPTNPISLSTSPPVSATSPVAAPNPPAPVVVMPTTPAPGVQPVQRISVPPMMPAPLLDNFYNDAGLNPSLWQTQSGPLASLAALNGLQVSPELAFSPSGMQMSGMGGLGQFTGIQSTYAYAPPFTLSATVTGMSQDAIPFEVYLVSNDLRQWLSVAGHLGGRGRVRTRVTVGFFGPFGGGGVRVPTGSVNGPDYGVWVNHTGKNRRISALGDRLFDRPLAGVPYTIQVTVDSDGVATMTLFNSMRLALASRSARVGMGPFHVVLAGRDGPTYAIWQSVHLTPEVVGQGR